MPQPDVTGQGLAISQKQMRAGAPSFHIVSAPLDAVSKLLYGRSLGFQIDEDLQRASARACKAYLISIYISAEYL